MVHAINGYIALYLLFILVSKLQELGFSKHDCEKALKESKYQLDQAASWLLENAQPVATSLSPKHKQQEEEESGGTFEIAGVEVRNTKKR